MDGVMAGLIVAKTGETWTYKEQDLGVPGLLTYLDKDGGAHGVYADEVEQLIRSGYFAGGRP